jgi:hypothetical protein
MEKLTMVWEKPFKFSEDIPKNLKAVVGLYMLEKDSKVFYVGKSEEQGGLKRAKDHLRGQMDKVGRCVVKKANAKDRDQINIWAGWIEQGENASLIDDAEKLLIWHFDSTCNETNRQKYNGQPLLLINEGDKPDFLPPEIPSPK